jgi:hypothetical protein
LVAVEALEIHKNIHIVLESLRTVAGQQMRTSYLRPASRCWRRYQLSTPWGSDAEGNSTGSCEGRMGCKCDRECMRRSLKLGWSWGRTTALGARNIVFSTLAFTLQTCVTMQSSRARTRIFGGQRAGQGHR